MVRKKKHCVVWDIVVSLPFDVDVIDVHLVQVSSCNLPFNRGTLSSSTGVNTNTQNFDTGEHDQITPLLTLLRIQPQLVKFH
jgi:hypothetical protein